MEYEKYFIATMILITSATIVGAINSKGTGRMVSSYFFSVLCVAITGYFVVGNIVKSTKNLLVETQGPSAEELALQRELDEQRAREEATKGAFADYKTEVNSILDEIKTINDRMRRINLDVDTDDEYERLRGSASVYTRKVKALKAKIAKLTVPSEGSSIQTSLKKAADDQAKACNNLRRYFNAEDEDEEERLSSGYKYLNRKATTAIGEVASSLKI